jgi:transposase-like protein
MEKMTMTRLAELVPDEAAAYRFLEGMRWENGPTCVECGHDDCVYLEPANGTSRRTRTGAMSARRVWQCRACRKQFSVLTGTVMQGTKISIRVWLFVMFEIASNKNGIAAREVERRYGLTPRSAWHLLHRLREAMGNDPLGMLGGEGHVIVADETFIGGSYKNMHKVKGSDEPVQIVPGEGARRPNPMGNKTAVLSLIDTDTGEVRSRVVPDVTAATLRKAIADQVHMSRCTLHTDESNSYNAVGAEFAAHETVNHSADEYVRYTPEGVVTSNQAENFFSQLKRSLDGTHHHVSAKHLHRYLGEFDFRHSTRGVSDTARMEAMVRRMEGVRLTYRPLVAA